MGLVKPLESGTTSSRVGDNHQTIDSKDLFTSVKDTYSNRDALSASQYPDTLNTLLSRVTGIVTSVEYYKKRHSFINNQLGSTSFALEEGSVHNSFDLIHNFELVLKEQIDIVQNPDTLEFEGEGSAYIYPGFKPHTGDIFLLRLLDDQVGVFVVDRVTKLTISRSSYYETTFVLYSYTTQDILDKLANSIRDELYFDKDKYFVDTVTILTDTTYKQLLYLQDMEKKLVNFMVSRFYERQINSFLRKDGVYDPNIVAMLFSIMSSDINIYQITSAFAQFYKNTILNALVRRRLGSLTFNSYRLSSYVNYAWDAYMTKVNNYKLLVMNDEDLLKDKRLSPEETAYSYIFSNRFYFALDHYFNTGSHINDLALHITDIEAEDSGYFANPSDSTFVVSRNDYVSYEDMLNEDTTTGLNNDMRLSDYEYVIYRYLTEGELNIQTFIDNILRKFPFTNMTETDKFYYIPVSLLLTRVALKELR